VLGIGADLDLKRMDLDKFENALNSLLSAAIGKVPAARCKTRFEQVDGRDVCLIDVDAGLNPTYADCDKGKGVFFVRQGNTTQQLDTKETVAYVEQRWGVH